MAKAYEKFKEVVKTVKEIEGITLELTKQEAKMLHIILGGSVSGISYNIYCVLNSILPYYSGLSAGILHDNKPEILNYVNS